MKKKTLTALILSAVLALSACGDLDDYYDDYDYDDYDYDDYGYGDNDGYGYDGYDDYYGGNSSNEILNPSDQPLPINDGAGFSLSVDGTSGKMNIERADKKSTPMGAPGTWTIFLYLCGTDLESDRGYGAASGDVKQILDAESNENVRFVIQTGGTSKWQNSSFDRKKCERWVINDGELELADSVSLSNMGSAATLAEFLEWGVKTYPAEKMGVIFWDHGGGSITGACFDELNDMDSLSLNEINSAFARVYEGMTDRFEFIGFDCCLMGTAETANIMATFSRYFYGSEEIEPGSGWDYTSIGTYLARNPGADGSALGKVVADSFYKECEKERQEEGCTFTIIDLDKFDDFLIAFNDYAKKLYDASESNLSAIVRGARSAENFGGNNRSEGYTNMVDIGGIIDNCSAYANGQAVLSALKNCIVYNINGSDHRSASGLAIYYPLELQGSNEIGIFSGVCISPYYLSLVDKAASGYSESGYDNSIFFGDDGNWESNNGDYGYFDDSYFYDDSDYDDYGGESSLITFEEEPFVDSDGNFGFVLDEDGLYYASYVMAYVFLNLDDDTFVCIGETDDIYGDWDTGEFYDNFDGYWLSLPDGQLLSTYIADTTDEYTVYTSPILLNGERTNLRFRSYWDDYRIEVEGVWDGIDESGIASREIRPLNAGDVIEAVYYLDDDSEFSDGSYTWRSGDNLDYAYLPQGEYYYGFEIDDCYGDYYVSDCVVFTIDEDGNIYFEY